MPTVSALARSGADAMPFEPELASSPRLEPQRYKVQFEASEEYVELVEKAKALLSQTDPRVDLGELHLRAMRVLVAELERKKYAATVRPRQRAVRAEWARAEQRSRRRLHGNRNRKVRRCTLSNG
jgi:hypothetical protein